MGKDSWDPEVQLFMPLFEVRREEVGWGCGDKAKADLGEPAVRSAGNPELEAGGWAALEGARQPGLCLLMFLYYFFLGTFKEKEHFISITTELLNEDTRNFFPLPKGLPQF